MPKKNQKNSRLRLTILIKKLRQLDSVYERSDKLYNELQFNLQTYEMQQKQYMQRLQELDYDEPLMISQEQLETAETALKQLRFELTRLGAVNQLSLDHYAEQASRYKELSVTYE